MEDRAYSAILSSGFCCVALVLAVVLGLEGDCSSFRVDVLCLFTCGWLPDPFFVFLLPFSSGFSLSWLRSTSRSWCLCPFLLCPGLSLCFAGTYTPLPLCTPAHAQTNVQAACLFPCSSSFLKKFPSVEGPSCHFPWLYSLVV